VVSTLVRLLRIASLIVCLIVIASFVTFAVEQTKTASGQQQAQISSPGEIQPQVVSHEGSVHKALDEASTELTSPFSAVVSGASSEWAIRGVKLLLALLVYGLGVGYLARMLRVRV